MSDFNIILPSKPRVVKEEDSSGVYEIDGLYPGYGHTLGNSLRRIILSSLPGAAITAIKTALQTSGEFATALPMALMAEALVNRAQFTSSTGLVLGLSQPSVAGLADTAQRLIERSSASAVVFEDIRTRLMEIAKNDFNVTLFLREANRQKEYAQTIGQYALLSDEAEIAQGYAKLGKNSIKELERMDSAVDAAVTSGNILPQDQNNLTEIQGAVAVGLSSAKRISTDAAKAAGKASSVASGLTLAQAYSQIIVFAQAESEDASQSELNKLQETAASAKSEMEALLPAIQAEIGFEDPADQAAMLGEVYDLLSDSTHALDTIESALKENSDATDHGAGLVGTLTFLKSSVLAFNNKLQQQRTIATATEVKAEAVLAAKWLHKP